jgi:hypothetical protein
LDMQTLYANDWNETNNAKKNPSKLTDNK